MNKALEVIKNPEQNQALHQKIIYALCNLNDYQSYYQERPMDDEEEKKERIKELLSVWKEYGCSKHFIFVNQNKEVFTPEQKEKIKGIFKEVVYTNLINHILFIILSDEGTNEAIKIKNGKVLINYWSGHL